MHVLYLSTFLISNRFHSWHETVQEQPEVNIEQGDWLQGDYGNVKTFQTVGNEGGARHEFNLSVQLMMSGINKKCLFTW